MSCRASMPRSENPPPPRDNPILSFPRKREPITTGLGIWVPAFVGTALFLLPRRRKVNPPALLHAAMAGFGEGDIANAGGKVAGEQRARCDTAQECFPPDTVRIAIGSKRRRFAPPLAVIGADVPHHAEMGDRRRLRN